MVMHPLKMYRKEANLTRDQLAEALGVSPSLVSLIEIGRRRITAENAVKWSGMIPVSKELLCPEIFAASANTEQKAA